MVGPSEVEAIQNVWKLFEARNATAVLSEQTQGSIVLREELSGFQR
jgi:hypothetical protein